jgi:DNA-binding SARP family transcriptional activator
MARQRIEIRLLGGMTLAADGRSIRLAGRHAPALLALLAMQPRSRSRDAVAADLWPESPTAASLRQSLWLVRSALANAGVDPDTLINADAETIGLVHGASTLTDVAPFERSARGPGSDPEAAIALYAGDFVEGLDHECFAAERERLADLFEDCLAAVAEHRLRAGDLGGARAAAERLLTRDPLREEAHAVLIAIYGRSGSRSQVVRQYRRLVGVLRRELDVEPLPETEIAYRTALATTIARSRAVAARVLQLGMRGQGSGSAPGGLSLAPTG